MMLHSIISYILYMLHTTNLAVIENIYFILGFRLYLGLHGKVMNGALYYCRKPLYVTWMCIIFRNGIYISTRHIHDICFKTNELNNTTKRRSEEKIIKIWRKMLNKKNFRQVWKFSTFFGYDVQNGWFLMFGVGGGVAFRNTLFT